MLFLLILIILTTLQLLLAIYGAITLRDLESKYSFSIGDGIDAAGFLELYSRVVRKVNLKVDADIKPPALAQNEFVHIKKRTMYSTTLYTIFYLAYQLELSRSRNYFIRNSSIFQGILFILQIVLMISSQISDLGPDLQEIALISALGVFVFLSGITLVVFVSYEFLLQNVVYMMADFMNVEDEEIGYLEMIKGELKVRAFTFPFTIFLKIYRFTKPF